ncbi:MAG: hypothetical protein U0271_21710 [Polyangiaceae bacterium]
MPHHRIVIAVAISLLSIVVSAGAAIALVVRLPADYFTREGTADPNRSFAMRLARNLLGVVLIFVGLVMSLPGVPGQGLLTIFVGLVLMDIPGKRRFERALVSRPLVISGINRIRARYARPPLLLVAPLPASREQSGENNKPSE